jgi:ceramide glucosyltransferase
MLKSELLFSLATALLVVAAIGTASSTVFLCLAIAGVIKFKRDAAHQKRAEKVQNPKDLPGVSVLKPLHGLEPQLADNIRSFFEQDYPAFEVILAVDHQDDPALPIARMVREEYPQVPCRILVTGEPVWPNPQIYSISKMVEAAFYDVLVSNDSDVMVDREYLRAVVTPLLDPQNGMVTCLYRGLNRGGFWSFLDSIGMSVEMTAGVVTANLLEGMKFGLGPTIALRRDALEVIGGCEALSHYFSHDFMTGNLIAQANYKVVLSRYVISHVVAPMSWSRLWNKELRWAVGTRYSRPKGHFGEGLIYAMPFGILGLLGALPLHASLVGFGLFGWSVLNRILEALIVGYGVTRDRDCLKYFWLYPIRDLLGFIIWAGSYLKGRLQWRAGQFELVEGGKIAIKTPRVNAGPNLSNH